MPKTLANKSLRCCRALIALATLAGVTPAFAQSYPAKPVRYIVPFPAAGTPDIIARQVTERLGRIWNQ